MKRIPQVAVLGAGIMGSTTALMLAQRGIPTTLFDAAKEPMSRASRWNEGKIHLGFLYAAAPSLGTARQLLPGGLFFKDAVERVISSSLDGNITPEDEVYLIHNDSVLSADATHRYLCAVSDLVHQAKGASRYLNDLSTCAIEPLAPREIEQIADARIIRAAYRIPERSVFTNWIADRYVEAISAQKQIEPMFERRVTGLRANDGSMNGQWIIEAGDESHGPFDIVVNALWESKLFLDSLVGLTPASEWSHRYRLSLFIHTERPIAGPSAAVIIGPFGDIKNYNNRDFYLSWYPAGLVTESLEIQPPRRPEIDRAEKERIERSTIEKLSEIIPIASSIYRGRRSARLEGGWVFAMGAGSLDDATSTLHQRDRIGVRKMGTYISVDTGKYSMAPWLANEIANVISGQQGVEKLAPCHNLLS